MSLSQTTLSTIAEGLRTAERNRTPMDSISNTFSGFSVGDGYSVQLMNAGRGLRDGRRQVGFKVGLTSKAAQEHFKVFEPDFGHLFQDMCLSDQGLIDRSSLIQPKIEGEIAFVLGRELKGPGVTVADAIRAVDYVVPCLEIIDSRIKEWKISAADTIADNGSSAFFVLGSKPSSLKGLDLSQIGMAFEVNGEVAFTGAGSAVLGNPIQALVCLANLVCEHDRALLPGEIILSGSLGSMVSVRAGETYRAEFWKLGSVSIRADRSEMKGQHG